MTLLLSYCATKASSFIAVHSRDKMTRQGFEEMIINRSVQHPSVDGDEGGTFDRLQGGLQIGGRTFATLMTSSC